MKTKDNTILITGGATGIGLALAERLSKLGNEIIICGRRENKLIEACQKLPGTHYMVCDLSKSDERKKLADWTTNCFPGINMLINNAGIQNYYNLKEPLDMEAIKQECEINFIAPVHLSNLFVEHFKRQNNPAIINITSGLAFAPLAFMPVYCATKAALHSFSLSLRHQLSHTPIKVFEIAPPTVDTELDKGERDKRERPDKGIKPEEFAIQAIEAISGDIFEAAIGIANNLRLKREELFSIMNH
jgi:uncharacterized oxidoreductase